MTGRPQLQTLADRLGVLPGYTDNDGTWQPTTGGAAERLVGAMGWPADSERVARTSLAQLDERDAGRAVCPFTVESFVRGVAPLLACTDGREIREGSVTGEDGTVRSFGSGVTVALPISQPGWYRVELVDTHGRTHVQDRVVHPERCMTVEEIAGAGSQPAFGVVANLYALRGVHGTGVGDLAALGELVEGVAPFGAEFVGCNPLHAIDHAGGNASPYCPDSRVFRNPLYLSLRDVPEYRSCERIQHLTAGLVDTDSVLDYAELWRTRLPVWQAMYEEFLARAAEERRDASAAFVAAQGAALDRYAAIMNDRRGDGPPGLYRFLQFEMDRQLAETALRAGKAGLNLGLYTDVAVGAAAGGVDAHVFRDAFVPELRIGAPPDAYAPEGQEWGVVPMRPEGDSPVVARYWRRVLQSAMAHAGLVRLDHVMGLNRQFLIPEGEPASGGAYVRFPWDQLMGVLALESHRHRTVVVGESLGTLPDGFLARLHDAGMLSTHVVYFEREADGAFRAGDAYPRSGLAQVNTHDLPTLPGYMNNRDVEVRTQLQLLDASEAEQARAQRQLDLNLLKERVGQGGVDDDTVALALAVYRFLAGTSSALIGVMFDDLAGELDAINVPEAAGRGYVPWVRRNGRTIEQVFRDGGAVELMNMIGTVRPGVLPVTDQDSSE